MENRKMQNLSPLQEFVFIRTYSRWLDDQKRRETFLEVLGPEGRYVSFMKKRFGDKIPNNIWTLIGHQLSTLGTMASMRAVWGAGQALEKNNIIGYNCCAIAIKDLKSLSELLYILCCGTGVGFTIEKQYINQIREVNFQNGQNVGTYIVADSKEAWADALYVALETWFDGKDISFDFSQVRPAGSRLKTMGGRASGPDPLRKLLSFCRNIIVGDSLNTGAQGRKLKSIEWLDICNMIAEIVVVGGVRRSSEVSFSDLDDDSIRNAKQWPFPQHRAMSNNSAVYFKKPDMITFMKEWSGLAASGTGERGIFNLEAAKKASPRREATEHLRSNPCLEILLNVEHGQFCNLSEVVVRSTDKFDDLLDKVKAAVWMGVMQASLTDFPYIRPSFKKICEEERLLGVSLTGQMDNPKLMTEEKLQILKDYAIKTCRKACKTLNINMSVAVTTGKPSGTVSQLVNCASGAHPRYAKYYIRRVRIDAKDPLCHMLKAQGVPMSPENGQRSVDIDKKRKELIEKGHSIEEAKNLFPDWNEDNVMMWVVSFPEAAPKNCLTRHEVTAIDQLEWYLKIKKNWCEHNQSITVYVKDDEWLKVGSWVYDHFDDIIGVSFLPFSGGHYEQAPYEEIAEKEYNKLIKEFPTIDYSQLSKFEYDDNTEGAKSYACIGDKCELV